MTGRKDPRSFIAVHDDIVNHPKVEALSDAAFRHLIRLWGHCNKFRTDGIVSDAKVREKGPKVFRELTTAPYPDSDPLVIPTGEGRWECRDYLKHQWSAQEIEERAAKNRENGAKGGRPRKPRP